MQIETQSRHKLVQPTWPSDNRLSSEPPIRPSTASTVFAGHGDYDDRIKGSTVRAQPYSIGRDRYPIRRNIRATLSVGGAALIFLRRDLAGGA